MDALTIPAVPRDAQRVPDRSPRDVPPTPARTVLTQAAGMLDFLARGHSRGLELLALSDALTEIASGHTEAACQALREAEALRRAGA
jgi:hypothetical protein